MRATDRSGELPVASYELFSQTEVLGRMAMERMLAGLSTRRYPARPGTGRRGLIKHTHAPNASRGAPDPRLVGRDGRKKRYRCHLADPAE
jgi:hypothetical protein